VKYGILSVFNTDSDYEEEDRLKPKVSGKARGSGSSSFLDEMNSVVKRKTPIYKSKSSKSAAQQNSWFASKTGFTGGDSYRDLCEDHQRVIIKTLLRTNGGKNFGRLKKHITYIQREGVSLDKEKGVLFSKEGYEITGKEFLEKVVDDRHHFRFIVSPEVTDELDLTFFIRELMEQAEKDLNTKLEWVAVNHYNTDNPHTHIVLRGKNDKGKDLLIPPNYITKGIRNRAREIATLELGYRTELDIKLALDKCMTAQRYTQIDTDITKALVDNTINLDYVPKTDEERQDRRLKTGRLKFLCKLGIAKEGEDNSWEVDRHLESKLRDLGKRGDIINTLARSMTRNVGESDIVYPEKLDKEIIGRVVDKGYSDELAETEYMIVEGVDGKHHYVHLDRFSEDSENRIGSIVKVHLGDEVGKYTDKKLHKYVKESKGIYDIENHKEWVKRNVKIPTEKIDSYVKNHVLRLNKLEKMGLVEKVAEGRWSVGDDLLENIKKYVIKDSKEKKQLIQVDELSSRPHTSTINIKGVTMLDKELLKPSIDLSKDCSLSNELKDSLAKRRTYLEEIGFLSKGNQVTKQTLEHLEKLELDEYRLQVKDTHIELSKSDMIKGEANIITLNSGKYLKVTSDNNQYVLVKYNRYHRSLEGKQIQLRSRDINKNMIIQSAAIIRGKNKEVTLKKDQDKGLIL